MSTDIGWGGGEGRVGYSDVDLKGQTLYLKFLGFRRDPNDPSRLLVKDRFKSFGYAKEDDGRVFKKPAESGGERVLVPADQVASQCYDPTMYWQFSIVKPFELAGEEPACSTTLKGIYFGMRLGKPYFEFGVVPSKGFSLSGFITMAINCGMNKLAVDSTGDLFDPEYIPKERLASLTTPLSFEQIVLKVVEPMLLDYTEEGWLVYAKTSPHSNWLQNKTAQALGESDRDKIQREYEAFQASQAPVEADTSSDGGADLRYEIRAYAGTGHHQEVVDAIRAVAPEADVNAAGSVDRIPADKLAAVLAEAKGEEAVPAL